MRRFAGFFVLLPIVPLAAQDPVRYRGPGELLPPALRSGPVAPDMDLADLTKWEFAWEFQRDALLPARAPGPPLPAAAQANVVAALRAGAAAEDAELAVLSLWGLARVGRDDAAAARALRELALGGALRRPAPVGEVAALALGLAARGDTATVLALRNLANDTPAGQALCGAPAVPERLRCFSLYGLGLAAEHTAAAELQFRVLAAVERLLLPATDAPPQVRIAALHALPLLRLDAAPTLPGPALVLLEHAWSFAEPRQWLSVRAQVPLAAAAMLRPGDPAAEAWRERFAAALQRDEQPAVWRSCAQALGRLCQPCETGNEKDARHGELLRTVARPPAEAAPPGAKDQQTRNLAFFAVGAIGGAHHRRWLTEQLAAQGGAGMLSRPWIGFGLGTGLARSGTRAEPEVIAALEAALATRNPFVFGGVALGLGLGGAERAAAAIGDQLRLHQKKEEAVAPHCVALALLRHEGALDLLREVAGSTPSPILAAEAMAAMAAIGGEPALAALRAWLLDGAGDRHRRGGAAAALRGRGDAASVAPFASVLADPQADLAARRFAAFALGSLGDRGERHWSARLASSIDYRSATPVLVGAPNGVLRLP